jgi:hypothetical protein
MMATVEAHLVNRTWARDPDGELVQIVGTRRTGMSMEFIIEKDDAKNLFRQLYCILYPEAPAVKSCGCPVTITKVADDMWAIS